MNIIILLLASFGLTFLIRQSEGPFGIISWFRNKLMLIPHIGVFFYKLLECPYCTGFWCGIIVYLINEKKYALNFLFLFALASAAACLIIDNMLSYFQRENN